MPLFLDAILCIFIRLKYNQNIFAAHKSHLYQRLAMAGFSHIRVTSYYLIAIVLNCIIYTFFNPNILYISNFLFLFLGIFMDKKYAIKFPK